MEKYHASKDDGAVKMMILTLWTDEGAMNKRRLLLHILQWNVLYHVSVHNVPAMRKLFVKKHLILYTGIGGAPWVTETTDAGLPLYRGVNAGLGWKLIGPLPLSIQKIVLAKVRLAPFVWSYVPHFKKKKIILELSLKYWIAFQVCGLESAWTRKRCFQLQLAVGTGVRLTLCFYHSFYCSETDKCSLLLNHCIYMPRCSIKK